MLPAQLLFCICASCYFLLNVIKICLLCLQPVCQALVLCLDITCVGGFPYFVQHITTTRVKALKREFYFFEDAILEVKECRFFSNSLLERILDLSGKV